jgi:1-acyl-sn-glycerol-3-phosphate acyltransferase
MIASYYIAFKASYYKSKSECIKNGLTPLLNSINIKINKFGLTDNNLPTLYVVNHQSYLDSIIIKLLKPEICTIAKSHVANDFSIIKGLSKNILDNWGVILYEIGNKESGQNVRKLIKENIESGKSILIYPEGTAHAYEGLKHFYKGSFEVAYENKFLIQPITLKYLSDITWGEKLSYSKDYNLDILKNVRKCEENGINEVNVTFHPIINTSKFDNAEHLMNYVKFVITDEFVNQHNYKI